MLLEAVQGEREKEQKKTHLKLSSQSGLAEVLGAGIRSHCHVHPLSPLHVPPGCFALDPWLWSDARLLSRRASRSCLVSRCSNGQHPDDLDHGPEVAVN